MADYDIKREVKIYVRSRKITRQGKPIMGWQVGFCAKSGGYTSVDRDEAIRQQQSVAKQYGFVVTDVVEVKS